MIFIIHFLSIISWTVSAKAINWESELTTRIAEPLVHQVSNSWTSNKISAIQLFNHKTHFGIIIKEGTAFTMKVKAPSKIEHLYFYCLTDSTSRSFFIIDLHNMQVSERKLTTILDCVPMISASYNISAEIKIETSNWIKLPIFDSKDITSKEAESEFYENVQVYGFVENYYTQMLLSANDVTSLKESGYSLYLGLQNQIDVIKYYNYLNDTNSLDRIKLFIRSERCCNNFGNNVQDSDYHFISGNIEAFLRPTKGSSWILLQKFAVYYNKENVDGLGETFDLLVDIFASLYQQKFKNNELVKSAFPYTSNAILSYQKGILFEKWSHEEKLNLFINLFGYGGTDTFLQEFRIRSSQLNRSNLNKEEINDFIVMILTILEMFLDLYDINLLPFLSKVINFQQETVRLLSPLFELRLLGGHPVMPAIDFNINLSELKVGCKNRDLRDISPLTLLSKLSKTYFEVEFEILSPVNLNGSCLYLNNECHNIIGHQMKLKLLSKVCSVYIVKEIAKNLYISEIMYHTISKNMSILIEVKQMTSERFPFIYYFFDFQGFSNLLCLHLSINYKDMIIRLEQLRDNIHSYYKDKLYFSISLKRNDTIIFEYKFLGWQSHEWLTMNEFQVNDILSIYHDEPNRLQLNGEKYSNQKNHNFVFTKVGLRNVQEVSDSKMIKNDIKQIDDFNKNYKIDLSYNAYYQVFLNRYVNLLISEGGEKYIPEYWIET